MAGVSQHNQCLETVLSKSVSGEVAEKRDTVFKKLYTPSTASSHQPSQDPIRCRGDAAHGQGGVVVRSEPANEHWRLHDADRMCLDGYLKGKYSDLLKNPRTKWTDSDLECAARKVQDNAFKQWRDKITLNADPPDHSTQTRSATSDREVKNIEEAMNAGLLPWSKNIKKIPVAVNTTTVYNAVAVAHWIGARLFVYHTTNAAAAAVELSSRNKLGGARPIPILDGLRRQVPQITAINAAKSMYDVANSDMMSSVNVFKATLSTWFDESAAQEYAKLLSPYKETTTESPHSGWRPFVWLANNWATLEDYSCGEENVNSAKVWESALSMCKEARHKEPQHEEQRGSKVTDHERFLHLLETLGMVKCKEGASGGAKPGYKETWRLVNIWITNLSADAGSALRYEMRRSPCQNEGRWQVEMMCVALALKRYLDLSRNRLQMAKWVARALPQCTYTVGNTLEKVMRAAVSECWVNVGSSWVRLHPLFNVTAAEPTAAGSTVSNVDKLYMRDKGCVQWLRNALDFAAAALCRSDKGSAFDAHAVLLQTHMPQLLTVIAGTSAEEADGGVLSAAVRELKPEETMMTRLNEEVDSPSAERAWKLYSTLAFGTDDDNDTGVASEKDVGVATALLATLRRLHAAFVPDAHTEPTRLRQLDETLCLASFFFYAIALQTWKWGDVKRAMNIRSLVQSNRPLVHLKKRVFGNSTSRTLAASTSTIERSGLDEERGIDALETIWKRMSGHAAGSRAVLSWLKMDSSSDIQNDEFERWQRGLLKGAIARQPGLCSIRLVLPKLSKGPGSGQHQRLWQVKNFELLSAAVCTSAWNLPGTQSNHDEMDTDDMPGVSAFASALVEAAAFSTRVVLYAEVMRKREAQPWHDWTNMPKSGEPNKPGLTHTAEHDKLYQILLEAEYMMAVVGVADSRSTSPQNDARRGAVFDFYEAQAFNAFVELFKGDRRNGLAMLRTLPIVACPFGYARTPNAETTHQTVQPLFRHPRFYTLCMGSPEAVKRHGSLASVMFATAVTARLLAEHVLNTGPPELDFDKHPALQHFLLSADTTSGRFANDSHDHPLRKMHLLSLYAAPNKKTVSARCTIKGQPLSESSPSVVRGTSKFDRGVMVNDYDDYDDYNYSSDCTEARSAVKAWSSAVESVTASVTASLGNMIKGLPSLHSQPNAHGAIGHGQGVDVNVNGAKFDSALKDRVSTLRDVESAAYQRACNWQLWKNTGRRATGRRGVDAGAGRLSGQKRDPGGAALHKV